ncbi:MAG: hypothetical protein K1W14_10970 [Muribaculaceae bacterium]
METDNAIKALRNADAILIGASNGLSIAEGYNIFADNDMFRSQFGDYQRRFGIRCLLEGFFFNYPKQTERQEFLDRAVKYWVTDYTPTEVMKDLLRIVGDKDYFIATTNGDTHLELSGFDPAKVFEIENTFERVAKGLPVDDKSRQLQEFLAKYSGKKIAILELGIGRNNRIIKPFLFQVAQSEPQSMFIALNMPNEIALPMQAINAPLALPGDIAITLRKLLKVDESV